MGYGRLDSRVRKTGIVSSFHSDRWPSMRRRLPVFRILLDRSQDDEFVSSFACSYSDQRVSEQTNVSSRQPLLDGTAWQSGKCILRAGQFVINLMVCSLPYLLGCGDFDDCRLHVEWVDGHGTALAWYRCIVFFFLKKLLMRFIQQNSRGFMFIGE